MLPIEDFASSKNLTTDQVLEGIKAGIYHGEYQKNRLYVSEKQTTFGASASKENQPHSDTEQQKTGVTKYLDKTTSIILVIVLVLAVSLVAFFTFITADKQPTEIQKAKIEQRISFCTVALSEGLESPVEIGILALNILQQFFGADTEIEDKHWKVKETALGEIINVTFNSEGTEFSCDFRYVDNYWDIHRVKRNGETVYQRDTFIAKATSSIWGTGTSEAATVGLNSILERVPGLFETDKEMTAEAAVAALEAIASEEAAVAALDGEQTDSSELTRYEQTYFEIESEIASVLSNSRKVMQVKVYIMTRYDERVIAHMEKHDMPVRSALMRIMARKTETDLARPTFRKELAEEFRLEINSVLERLEDFGGVESVGFTAFVVQ